MGFPRQGFLFKPNGSSSATIVAWTAFTPTGSWVSNTTYAGYYRIVGDTMDVQYLVSTSGAPTSTGLTLNLPSGRVIDTNKVVAAVDGVSSLLDSEGFINDSGARAGMTKAVYKNTTSFYVGRDTGSGTVDQITQANPITFGAGDSVQLIISVPIV